MDYVPYAVPFFLLAILIELAYGIIKKNNTYRLNDAISSLFMGSLRSANKLIIISFGGYIFYHTVKCWGAKIYSDIFEGRNAHIHMSSFVLIVSLGQFIGHSFNLPINLVV